MKRILGLLFAVVMFVLLSVACVAPIAFVALFVLQVCGVGIGWLWVFSPLIYAAVYWLVIALCAQND